MFVTIIATCYNTLFDVPQSENTQINTYISFSKRGFEEYGQLNLNTAFAGLLNTNLGDFTISAAGFDFTFQDIIIIELLDPLLSVNIYEDSQSAGVILSGFGFDLTFSFLMLQ